MRAKRKGVGGRNFCPPASALKPFPAKGGVFADKSQIQIHFLSTGAAFFPNTLEHREVIRRFYTPTISLQNVVIFDSNHPVRSILVMLNLTSEHQLHHQVKIGLVGAHSASLI